MKDKIPSFIIMIGLVISYKTGNISFTDAFVILNFAVLMMIMVDVAYIRRKHD